MQRAQNEKKQIRNPAIIDNAKTNPPPLPLDILNDLNEAFRFYDKEETGEISEPHFRNILHNFGFHRHTKRDTDDELKRTDPEFARRNCVPFNFVKHVVAHRWARHGKTEEAKECFRLFDKRDRAVINAQEIKSVLSNYLEFPITDQDVQDFMLMCDPSGSGHVTASDFQRLYLSQ